MCTSMHSRFAEGERASLHNQALDEPRPSLSNVYRPFRSFCVCVFGVVEGERIDSLEGDENESV